MVSVFGYGEDQDRRTFVRRKHAVNYAVAINVVGGVGTLLEIFPSAPLPEISLPTIRLTGTDTDRLASDWSRIGGDFSVAMKGASGNGKPA